MPEQLEGAEQGLRDAFAVVRDHLAAAVAAGVVPSLAIAVARGDNILWAEAFGWADRERQLRASPYTAYALASVSKPLTATGLMVLVERGLVDLDRPINDYLGETKVHAQRWDTAAATVRRVANNTAGLPMHGRAIFADEVTPRLSIEEAIGSYGFLMHAPGERHTYSNLGYGLLGEVIARQSGMTFADFMHEEVFVPLGMTHAALGIPPGDDRNVATRYDERAVPIPFYDTDTPGAAGMVASVHDLVRFGMFHLGHRASNQRAILAPASLTLMHTPTSVITEGIGYGIGWGVFTNYWGQHLISHSGDMSGVHATLLLLPSEDLVVAVLMNEIPASVQDNATITPLLHPASLHPAVISVEVVASLLPSVATQLATFRLRGSTDGEDAAPHVPRVALPTSLTGSWHGEIVTPFGIIRVILSISETGATWTQGGTDAHLAVEDLRYHNGWVSGRINGEIDTPEVHRPHRLILDLRLRGRTLNGAVVAAGYRGNEEGRAGRLASNLSHWVELRRK